MVAKLDKVMHDFIMLSGWKKSLGASVSFENDHNYGGLAPTQNLGVFCITAPNIHFCDAQTTEEISSFDPKGKFNFLEIISDRTSQKKNLFYFFSSLTQM